MLASTLSNQLFALVDGSIHPEKNDGKLHHSRMMQSFRDMGWGWGVTPFTNKK
jgi:hypothetical protein